MERLFLLITILVSLLSHAQSDVPPILATDPWTSNGYFIVDETVRAQLGIAYIEVEVSVSQYQSNGSYTREVAETFQIVPPAFYDHADPDLPSTLDDGERVFYHITAFDANHEIVDEWDSIGDGDEVWPEICRETCNAAAYAWTLVGYSDGGQTLVELHEATQNGSYYYFYVKEADWPQFKAQFTPSVFNVPGDWNDYPNPLSNWVEYVSPIPPNMRDYTGYSLGNNPGPGYAVYKSKGPWAGFVIPSEPVTGGEGQYCVAPGMLQDVYNSDANVQFHMDQLDLDPLTCTSYLSSGGGLSWGDGSSSICTQFSIDYTFIEGEIDIVGWAVTTVACPVFAVNSLSGVSSIIVEHVDLNGGAVLTIPIAEVSDPRLLAVPKTPLYPGLYEFTLVFNDGTMFRHYQEFNEQVDIVANFASFTDVDIYPVPVTEAMFSIDLDLLAPTECELTVANTSAVVYHSETLSFPYSGLNKHVVRMSPPWPSGIYHGRIDYPDGSFDAFNLIVE